jgi:RNA methyltransferase, TrmH family
MIISSTSNSQVKIIRKLRDRKARQESGLFYIEGLRIVGEAFEQGAKIQTLIAGHNMLTSTFGIQLVTKAIRQGIPILEVTKEVFESIALKEGPQGIAAVVEQNWTPLEDVSMQEKSLWVALDSPQDPGNVGTILRTLDSVGGEGLILVDLATDPYDPTSVRASMGSIFNLKIVKCDFEDFADWKEKNGVSLIGTSGAAENDYHYTTYPSSLVLLMGSERVGLLDHHFALCDQLVRIPMVGKSDSLNLAVSTAITLYEIFNHHRDASLDNR